MTMKPCWRLAMRQRVKRRRAIRRHKGALGGMRLSAARSMTQRLRLRLRFPLLSFRVRAPHQGRGIAACAPLFPPRQCNSSQIIRTYRCLDRDNRHLPLRRQRKHTNPPLG